MNVISTFDERAERICAIVQFRMAAEIRGFIVGGLRS